MVKTILHISDFHVHDTTALSEPLRKSFYIEYIDSLVDALEVNGIKVDYLVVTGDLIDIGKTENFPHVEKILTYLASALQIEKSKVCFCIGNHDYKVVDENGKNSNELRKPFYELAAKFGNTNATFQCARASVFKIDEDLVFLSLDPTIDLSLEQNYESLVEQISKGGKDTRKLPAKVLDTEHDAIIDALRDVVTTNTHLVIGCHYPPNHYPESTLGAEEDDFSKNHVWAYGAELRNRINALKTLSTSWYSGDTHAGDSIQVKKTIYVMTGRFGVTKSKTSQQRRQVKIVELGANGNHAISTFSDDPRGHNDSFNSVRWDGVLSRIRPVSPVKAEASSELKSEQSEEIGAGIHLISEELETQILERIVDKKLYSFGRFKTSENSTSLGWVAIAPLLNTGSILPALIGRIRKRIFEVLKLNVQSSVCLGLDFWGAIISSQVAVSTGALNFCVATRGNGLYHSDLEVNLIALSAKLKSVTDIVIIIDVVSCGNTIKRVINDIEKRKEELKIETKIKYHIISVITDGKQFDPDNLAKVTSFGTFCKNLRIPVVENDFLPNESIIRTSIDFSR